MANSKISALTAATTPVAGTEVLPIVQSAATVKVAVNDLTVKNVRSNVTTGILQIAGPAAAATRIMTTPDANFTAARTDAANNFTGDQTLSTGNLVQGTAAKGVNFTANTPLAGMTSQLLNWYEQGTYTPTFTADSGTAPSLGNGTLTGAYTRIGRLVQAQVKLLLGTTTTMGSGGVLQFGLPFSASSVAGATGTAYIDDTGTGWTIGFPTLRTTTIVDISLAVPGVIGTSRVTNTAPMIWATGDSLVISFVYFV